MTRMQAAAKIYCELYASGMAAGLKLALQTPRGELRAMYHDAAAAATTATAWEHSDPEFRQYVRRWLTLHARVLLGLSRGEELAAEDARDFLDGLCAEANKKGDACHGAAPTETGHKGEAHVHDEK